MFDVTLSFDNGPEREVTPAVLETLAEAGVLATFFVIGEKAQRAQDLCARAHAEDHWVGNHTWSHSIPLGLRTEPGAAEAEIERTDVLLEGLRGPRRLFRPFAGRGRGGELGPTLLSPDSVRHLTAHKHTCVLWNVVAREWERPDDWVEPALALCAEQSHALIVLHDLPNGAMRHLGEFIAAVRRSGGQFRQDFPPDCVPIEEGVIVRPLDAYVSAGEMTKQEKGAE